MSSRKTPRPPLRDLRTQAKALGFTLGQKRQSGGQKPYYPLIWQDRQREEHSVQIEDLTELEPRITQLIADGKARQPGEFYICWWVRDYITDKDPDFEPWCRCRRWVQIHIVEGALAHYHWPYTGFDTTAYPSAKAAVDTLALLPLETGARLELSAIVRPISDDWEFLPTTACTPETIEVLVMDLIRYGYPAGIAPDNLKKLAMRLQFATGLWEKEGIRAMESMIAQGRLIRDRHHEGPCPTRRIIRVAES